MAGSAAEPLFGALAAQPSVPPDLAAVASALPPNDLSLLAELSIGAGDAPEEPLTAASVAASVEALRTIRGLQRRKRELERVVKEGGVRADAPVLAELREVLQALDALNGGRGAEPGRYPGRAATAGT